MFVSATLSTLLALSGAHHAPAPASPAAFSPQQRGWIGVALEVRPDASGASHVVVGSVAPDSPAQKAGLAAGDVLLAIDGSEIGTVDDLTAALQNSRPRQRVTIGVLRRFTAELASSREDAGRAWLGVSIEDGGRIEMLGEVGRAVRISSVRDGSPAEAAGLQRDDSVVVVGGQVARGADALIGEVAAQAPGDTLSLAIARDLRVVLGRRPDALDATPEPGEIEIEIEEFPVPAPPQGPSGLEDAPRGYLGIYLGGGDDAVVSGAVEHGPAADAGLQPGDVIVAVDGQQVASSSALVGALSDTKPGQRIEVVIRRGDEEQRRVIELGAGPLVFGEAVAPEPSTGLFEFHGGAGEGGELSEEFRGRLHHLLQDWHASQEDFQARLDALREEAGEQGSWAWGMVAPHSSEDGPFGLHPEHDGQAHWFQLPEGRAFGLRLGELGEERNELRAELKSLRGEIEGLRKELAGLRKQLRRATTDKAE